jgi:hypothetical protein
MNNPLIFISFFFSLLWSGYAVAGCIARGSTYRVSPYTTLTCKSETLFLRITAFSQAIFRRRKADCGRMKESRSAEVGAEM